MQRWSNRPRISTDTTPLTIIRVRPSKPVSGIVLSHDVEGAELHYWKGRSRVCDDKNCEACEANFRARWYGYLEIWSSTTGRSVIVELTAAAAPAIDEYFKEHHTLRGAVMKAARVNRKINSKLTATFEAGPLPESNLPNARKIRTQLEFMWETASSREPEKLHRLQITELDADPKVRENGAASTRQTS